MCEYCGCQQIPAIAELTDEHERLRDLGSDLAAAARDGDLDTARTLAQRMHGVLGPHTAVEEHALFPALSAEFGEGMDVLVAEHRTIHDALHCVLAEPPPADWAARVGDGLHRLFEHILKEQDGVFPAALATLTPQDWGDVERVRAEVGTPSRTGS